MYQETERTRKVGGLLRKELADILLRELDDRRFRMISITQVTLSRDLKNATVFVTGLAKDDVTEEVSSLNEMKGFIRKQLSRRVYLKRLPTIQFRQDDSVSRGMRLSQLIESVNEPESQDN
jgi:ribosome-binding factor A